MDRIDSNTDPKKNRSMLFRLFAGDKNAATPSGIYTADDARVTDATKEVVSTEDIQQADATEQTVANTASDLDSDVKSSDVGSEQTTDEAAVEREIPPPVDAGIKLRISSDGMEAYVTLTPPQNGGAEIGAKAIRAALKAGGVINGVIDRAMFEISMSKPYNSGEILVAQGKPKEDGKDGEIIELFTKEIDISPYQNPDGTVDFKRLNIVREVKAGTAISTHQPPTDGVDGVNVRGEAVKAKPGKPQQLLRGANTIISDDGLQLLAEKDGHLTYKDGRFTIETTFVVEGSMDNNTGNIAFGGDVIIKGDVREGYIIRAGGAVKVKGIVEGGSIYAQGNIVLDGGFNGMKRGELETTKSITSKFLQNCTVKAKENISSEAVINSVIFCDGQLDVTKNKGVIVGGRCTVLYSVEAKVIGTDVNTPTQITVGLSPTVLAEKQEMEKAIDEIENSKDMLNKNLLYLERCAKMGKLSDKNIALQESCNKQKVLILVREATYHKRLDNINATIEEASAGSMVKAQTVYPSTKITIKSQSLMTKSLQHRCIFRMEKGELITTTF